MSFTSEIERFVKVVNDRTARAKAVIAGDLLRAIVHASPVDTGQFKANWRVSLNATTRASIKSFDKGGQSTISAGLEVIGRAKPTDRVYIGNNLPYARRIEYGWSQQAPYGVVRVQVARLQGIVTSAVRAAREQVK